MNRRGVWKTVTCLVGLALVSAALGGLLGRRLARSEFAHRSDPSHWNETAMRNLERTLKPTPEQQRKIQDYLDSAVAELTAIRAETIHRSAAIVIRLVDQVDKELTPEQRTAFERIKPKPSDLSNLNLLNVGTGKKKP